MTSNRAPLTQVTELGFGERRPLEVQAAQLPLRLFCDSADRTEGPGQPVRRQHAASDGESSVNDPAVVADHRGLDDSRPGIFVVLTVTAPARRDGGR